MTKQEIKTLDKVCKDCGEKKVIYKYSRCLECFKKDKSVKDKIYRERNREKLLKKQKEYFKSGPERLCKHCGKPFKSPLKKRMFCGKFCQYEFWRANGIRKRQNNPAWKNGSHQQTYRRIFLEHCGKEGIDLEVEPCQLCGKINQPAYDIHHIVFRSEAPKHPALNTPINLIWVCRSCHNYLHRSKRQNRKILVDQRGLEKIFNRNLND